MARLRTFPAAACARRPATSIEQTAPPTPARSVLPANSATSLKSGPGTQAPTRAPRALRPDPRTTQRKRHARRARLVSYRGFTLMTVANPIQSSAPRHGRHWRGCHTGHSSAYPGPDFHRLADPACRRNTASYGRSAWRTACSREPYRTVRAMPSESKDTRRRRCGARLWIAALTEPPAFKPNTGAPF